MGCHKSPDWKFVDMHWTYWPISPPIQIKWWNQDSPREIIMYHYSLNVCHLCKIYFFRGPALAGSVEDVPLVTSTTSLMLQRRCILLEQMQPVYCWIYSWFIQIDVGSFWWRTSLIWSAVCIYKIYERVLAGNACDIIPQQPQLHIEPKSKTAEGGGTGRGGTTQNGHKYSFPIITKLSGHIDLGQLRMYTNFKKKVIRNGPFLTYTPNVWFVSENY